MSIHSTLDPESFQRLLASAFAVQESGMDSQSLSAIVELQSIVTDECDVDRAVHLIAERARNVANASGIRIGLLMGDQLVYRAGSGSAAAYVGRHLMATLSVSAHNEASGEILRVENTQTDARIEAAICRQFGAKALLILPIYHDRAVAGVLEVLCNEAHAFQDREVRTYRLMAGLVGEAMSRATQLEQKKALAAKPSTMRQGIEQITPQIQTFNEGGSVLGAANNRAIRQASGASIAGVGELPALREPAGAATMITQRAKCVPLYRRRWKTAVAVAAVLVIASWIVCRDGRPASPLGASALKRSNAIEQHVPFVPAKRVSGNSTSTPQTVRRPVRVGESQVDYIGEDVTVRYFTPKHAPRPVRVGNYQIHYIGEDVTVRYFTPKQAVAPPRPVGSTAQPVDR
jgi:GAF domain-containing protein